MSNMSTFSKHIRSYGQAIDNMTVNPIKENKLRIHDNLTETR